MMEIDFRPLIWALIVIGFVAGLVVAGLVWALT
jgi:CHASE3 domain sensor protein